jgi:hypothetical protein
METKRIKSEQKESATGTMFIDTYPAGFFGHPFEEVRVTHITNWKKMMNIMSCIDKYHV